MGGIEGARSAPHEGGNKNMKTLKSFFLGAWEFRYSFTSCADDPAAYDWGREWAHRLTFRKFEQ